MQDLLYRISIRLSFTTILKSHNGWLDSCQNTWTTPQMVPITPNQGYNTHDIENGKKIREKYRHCRGYVYNPSMRDFLTQYIFYTQISDVTNLNIRET